MIAIQTKTGSKIHALEPNCMRGDYDYPFHPLCTGGKGRTVYQQIPVKKLGSTVEITCKRCLKIISMDTERFSEKGEAQNIPAKNHFKSSLSNHHSQSSSTATAVVSLVIGFALLIIGLWGFFAA